VLGLGLIGFSFSAIIFGMTTGIGVMREVSGKPQAIRDIVVAGAHDTEITISTHVRARPSHTCAHRGRLRPRFTARADTHPAGGWHTLDQPYRIIKWESGSVSLSDTATGERIYLNAFGPDHAAAYEQLLASRGNEKP
jgi:hypothetical protein